MHEFQKKLLDAILKNEGKRIVVMNARQMGKTFLGQQIQMAVFDEMIKEKSTYIKKFYLRSGTFEFKLYGLSKTWELTKISKPGKWQATNIKFIFDFLVRRGAKQKDLAEIEQKILEVIS